MGSQTEHRTERQMERRKRQWLIRFQITSVDCPCWKLHCKENQHFSWTLKILISDFAPFWNLNVKIKNRFVFERFTVPSSLYVNNIIENTDQMFVLDSYKQINKRTWKLITLRRLSIRIPAMSLNCIKQPTSATTNSRFSDK